MLGDEVWDEDRWEAFLRDNDRRVSRYMDLLNRYFTDDPPPNEDDASARADWEERLEAFMRARGFRAGGGVLPPAPGDEEMDEDADLSGDAWSEGTLDDEFGAVEDEADPFQDDLAQVAIYQHTFDLATDVLDWSNTIPGAEKDSTLVQFCAQVNQIPANVAKGHGIGYEKDTLGGNIACVKRGLAAANKALVLLQELREAPYMTQANYLRMYEALFETRNELGLYVQELRRRFELGID